MARTIELPAGLTEVRDLRVGEAVYLTGELFTARDAAHRLLLDLYEQGKEPPFDPACMGIYHCGPLVKKTIDGGWRVLSAGPTTSLRMEPFEDRFLGACKSKIIIGKGGMGLATQAALVREKAVYLHFTGGAGALAARAIDRVEAVFWLEELGMAEAVWIFHVTRFGPLLVTMDSRGGNIHRDRAKSLEESKHKLTQQIERSGGKIERGRAETTG